MEIVKFFHLLGLMMGGGAGFGHMGTAIAHKKAGGGPPTDTIKALKQFFGMIGMIGILLLWITGIIMTGGYETSALGLWFYIKLLCAAGILGINIWIMLQVRKAGAAGTPPPAYIESLGKINSPLALGAMLIAVYIF